MGAVVCMHRDLGQVDAVGVGMFLQTLVLALTERGLGTCVQVSIAAYPEILRAHLGIPEELTVLCGLSIGYPDPAFPANSLTTPRNPAESRYGPATGRSSRATNPSNRPARGSKASLGTIF